MLIIEAIFRFSIEYVRYYEAEMETQIGGITFTYNHLIAVALFAFGVTLFLILRRNRSVSRN